MAHIELMVVDAYSPNLLRSCAKYEIVATPNPDKEDFVHFSGETDNLIKLIREEFDSGSEEDLLYLISLIQ